ncbi:PREDICTED: peptidyl-prolyl cis-trans isomerase FKBP1A isoform X1 [Chinchilla lanigera]|uniref:peptidyl-prolyl cis-trans isomerase FKBP1A isoform X1 n=1 Tax=Chinchilla lanigera TaxID=34839 RepID=UPI0006977BA4|nr:PREDICTED: peptidyl-prolyl cis-trans isomerase FKBP1A isoform X1 [Chinchilla lanigera]
MNTSTPDDKGLLVHGGINGKHGQLFRSLSEEAIPAFEKLGFNSASILEVHTRTMLQQMLSTAATRMRKLEKGDGTRLEAKRKQVRRQRDAASHTAASGALGTSQLPVPLSSGSHFRYAPRLGDAHAGRGVRGRALAQETRGGTKPSPGTAARSAQSTPSVSPPAQRPPPPWECRWRPSPQETGAPSRSVARPAWCTTPGCWKMERNSTPPGTETSPLNLC